jgi:hypothetical protein
VRRRFAERVLDRPQRWIERSRVDPQVKLLLAATVRYLKQIVRSRSRA